MVKCYFCTAYRLRSHRQAKPCVQLRLGGDTPARRLFPHCTRSSARGNKRRTYSRWLPIASLLNYSTLGQLVWSFGGVGVVADCVRCALPAPLHCHT
eukprot:1467665-Pleurochrysis_carterae.AAC.6